ncbi:MAG: hypothetical protein HKN23_12280 [Verrucomicrobiales bacterium]|nr:hypothetical protein [Verrucomicrobiales bacterium]
MKTPLFALLAVAVTFAAVSSALAMVSVASVKSLDEMPKHLKFRTSPATQHDLINVWITVVEPNPKDVGVWASLTTKVDGKIHSRASLVSHKKEDGFSLSFQMPRESFDESTIMIAVRGNDLRDVGHEVALKLFKPEKE